MKTSLVFEILQIALKMDEREQITIMEHSTQPNPNLHLLWRQFLALKEAKKSGIFFFLDSLIKFEFFSTFFFFKSTMEKKNREF